MRKIVDQKKYSKFYECLSLVRSDLVILKARPNSSFNSTELSS